MKGPPYGAGFFMICLSVGGEQNYRVVVPDMPEQTHPDQHEKSKIKISAPKIPILFMSDWGDTGFGTVGKNLCPRLAEMEVFDVHYLGWFSRDEDKAEAQQYGFTLHNTKGSAEGDHFGNKSFAEVVQKVQPRVVITLGDPWMVAYVNRASNREEFMWVAYVPIDRDNISRSWRKIMRKPDVLVLYSQFGVDIVNEQIPFRDPQLILHGVDKTVFRPWYPPGMDENTPMDELMCERKRITMGEPFKDRFVVGFVGRNQIRKGIPRIFRAFKAFNCEVWTGNSKVEVMDEDGGVVETYHGEDFCPNNQKFRCDICPAFQQRPETEHSILYMHTTPGDGKDPQDKPGIGWLIPELGERYGLHGRVGMTPNLSVLRGLPREALSQLINCFDVHCFLSHSEGFGLPIAESLCCGVPTLVTDYSAMPELVSGGGGMTVEVHDYETYVTWENDWASADIGDAAAKINQLFEDEELYTQMRKDAAANTYIPTWDDVAMQFRDLIMRASI